MIMPVCIAILLPTLLGFFILAVILRNDRGTPLGERIGLAFPLGAGILTFQIFLLGIMRVPLTLTNTTLPVLTELILIAIWIWRRKILLIPDPGVTDGLVAEFLSPRNHWLKKGVFAVLLLWIVSKLFSVFLLTGLRPVFAWDAWANWSAGAKVFFHSHSLLLDVPAQDFFGENAVDRNVFYPLHNTLMQLWISLWIGRFDDVYVKFASPAYLLSMAVCFYYTAYRETNRLFALVMLGIVLSSPLLSYHSIELYSDQMLGVYLFLASVSFLKAMKGNASYWLLAGIYSTEAIFTKNEAFFFVIPFVLSAIMYLRADVNSRSIKFAHIRSLIAPLLVLIIWYGFQLYYGLEFAAMLATQARQTLHFWIDSSIFNINARIFGAYLYYLMSLQNFNVIFFFFPVMLLAHGKLSRECIHLLFPVACYMLFFLMLYLFITGFYSSYSMCLARNMLTFYPVVCLLMVLLLKKHITIPSVTTQRTSGDKMPNGA